MKGRVWRWIVALSVFTEIVAARYAVIQSNERNVALNASCNQSSFYVAPGRDVGYCRYLINGNPNDDSGTRVICFHTAHQDFFPILTVTLRHSYYIHKLIIYPRTGWEGRLQNLQIFFDLGRFTTISSTFNQRNFTLKIAESDRQHTSTVTVRKQVIYSNDPVPYLNFCELEVYSSAVQTKVIPGQCCMMVKRRIMGILFVAVVYITCSDRFWGPRCELPCNDTCVECDAKNGSCLGCRQVGYWGLEGCRQKCGKGCTPGTCSVSHGACECRQPQQQHWKPPNCERCSKDYWGENCTRQCPKKCKATDQEGYCDPTSGRCLKGCLKDYWGENCTRKCSTTCNGTNHEGYCDRTSGRCLTGCIDGRWGDNCSNTCGVGCQNQCKQRSGACYCQPGWKGPRCEVPSCACAGEQCSGSNRYVFSELSRKINVAVGKTSIASSTLKEPERKAVSGEACLANNGKTMATMTSPGASIPECMSTARGDLKPFWQVDLGKQYVIAGILIDWDDQMKSKFGIRVLLDDKQLYYSKKQMVDPTEVFANKLGQVVKLQRETFQDNNQWDDPLLRICEVEVYTCRPGYYGHDCLQICERPVCENSQICSRIDGSCPKAAPVEEPDCSILILVAGCFVAFLVIALFIFAALVLPKKTSWNRLCKKKPKRDESKEHSGDHTSKGSSKGSSEGSSEGSINSSNSKEDEREDRSTSV